MPDSTSKCKFAFGQQIHHKLFDYYGVIVAVDPCYKGDDQWYEMVARSRPPKEKPWYHVKKTDGRSNLRCRAQLRKQPSNKQLDPANPLSRKLFYSPKIPE